DTLQLTGLVIPDVPQLQLFGLYFRSNETQDGRPVYILENTVSNPYKGKLYHITTPMKNEWVISETVGEYDNLSLRIHDDAIFPELIHEAALSEGFYNNTWMGIPSLKFNCFR
ncbi:unnamed protein product, partial [Owenia fusiformis]